MQYQMKQKLFVWGDDFTIRTGGGEDAFQLSFQDMAVSVRAEGSLPLGTHSASVCEVAAHVPGRRSHEERVTRFDW